MKYIQSANSYTCPINNAGIRRPRRRRASLPFPGGVAFWKIMGRISLVVFAVTISLNMVLGLYQGHLESEIQKVAAYQSELVDERVRLRIKKVELRSKDAIKDAAGKNLSLFAPGSNQHFKYDSNLGRFVTVKKDHNVASL
ncbi:hypothetical protein [Desulfosediminicola flagellatus]|uniref:hypothetical protein n=1 Tax=Desulfosediminicola flagellatus TaxID=2569541 RepID=UPI0010ACB642|nr:hypothetical protein [Desulfosediminicola flagellatus]